MDDIRLDIQRTIKYLEEDIQVLSRKLNRKDTCYDKVIDELNAKSRKLKLMQKNLYDLNNNTN